MDNQELEPAKRYIELDFSHARRELKAFQRDLKQTLRYLAAVEDKVKAMEDSPALNDSVEDVNEHNEDTG